MKLSKPLMGCLIPLFVSSTVMAEASSSGDSDENLHRLIDLSVLDNSQARMLTSLNVIPQRINSPDLIDVIIEARTQRQTFVYLEHEISAEDEIPKPVKLDRKFSNVDVSSSSTEHSVTYTAASVSSVDIEEVNDVSKTLTVSLLNGDSFTCSFDDKSQYDTFFADAEFDEPKVGAEYRLSSNSFNVCRRGFMVIDSVTQR